MISRLDQLMKRFSKFRALCNGSAACSTSREAQGSSRNEGHALLTRRSSATTSHGERGLLTNAALEFDLARAVIQLIHQTCYYGRCEHIGLEVRSWAEERKPAALWCVEEQHLISRNGIFLLFLVNMDNEERQLIEEHPQ